MTDHTPFTDEPAPADDARIDALARSAGAALRRPAPDDGLAHVRRSKQRRQAVRAGATGVTLAALAVVGVVSMRGGDQRTTVVPATADTAAPGPTGGPSTSAAPPGTEVPTTAPTSPTTTPGGAGSPVAVYGGDTAVGPDGSLESRFDPLTGELLGTGAMDGAASLAAQQQWYGAGATDAPGRVLDAAELDRPGVLGYELDLGDVLLRYDVLPSEMPTLDDQDPAALPYFDRCQQTDLRVSGGSAPALPARVLAVAASADRRFLTVLRADCPTAGTLADGVLEGGYDIVAEVYDVAQLDQPPRRLFSEPAESCGCTLAGFSPDSRYVAIRELASDLQFRVFALGSGDEVVLTDQCREGFSAFADQYGPWVGDSTIALVVDCGDGPALLVMDVDEPARASSYPSPAANVVWAEVDVAHLDDPANAWYVLCGTDDLATPATCWVGQGDGSPIELPGVSTASFLPLGFRAGG